MTDDKPENIPGLGKYLPAQGKLQYQPPKEYDRCKKCGNKLYGGERYGEGANGYCDSCN